jgi:DNA-directed RNA polymerase subunit M/transcription elongation factor TFIIS
MATVLKSRGDKSAPLRFPCRECGAVLKYAPGTNLLVCEYCGTENPIQQQVEPIQEYDLNEALQRVAEKHSEPVERSIHCDECGAGFQFEATIHAGECPFCGTPIVTTTAEVRPIQAKSLLPFIIDETTARQQFKRWISGLWFAPNAVKKYARSDTKLTGVYLPYWTFDSHTSTAYSGERGDIYYVTEQVQVVRNNQTVIETRQVPKIRWTPVSGQVGRFFDDVLIGASKSLPRQIVDALEPWDLQALIPYDEQYLSGFRSEFYQVELGEGFDYARQLMDNQIYQDICRDIGGDHQRIHQVQTRHSRTTYKHCLLPIWSAAFRFKEQAYRFVINGRTGKVQGERPYSAWKIGFAVLLGLTLVAGLYVYLEKSGALQNLQNHPQVIQYYRPQTYQYRF